MRICCLDSNFVHAHEEWAESSTGISFTEMLSGFHIELQPFQIYFRHVKSVSYYICFFFFLRQYFRSTTFRISKLNEGEKSTGAEDIFHLRNGF